MFSTETQPFTYYVHPLYIRRRSLKRHERNTGKMTFATASGLLPAGIAVYVQRGPNGVGLETRYSVYAVVFHAAAEHSILRCYCARRLQPRVRSDRHGFAAP